MYYTASTDLARSNASVVAFQAVELQKACTCGLVHVYAVGPAGIGMSRKQTNKMCNFWKGTLCLLFISPKYDYKS